MKRIGLLLLGCLMFQGKALSFDSGSKLLDARLEVSKNVVLNSRYDWKRNIITTMFWIGNNRNGYNSTVNFDSAWDSRWYENYGGNDDPKDRVGSRPRKFFPKLNPFYIALPFNDVVYPSKARQLIPWFQRDFKSRWTSVCKGKWVAVHYRGKFAFGTWEDVGPFRVDNAEYVFGNGSPNTPTGAGLDVSPAIRDYLGLSGKDRCDWRFVEDYEVPTGPWVEYGEKALVLNLIQEKKKKGQPLPAGARDYKPEG
ncbi:MAG: hypothetical protein R3F23_08430 [Verrucomicrobiia bacterium]